MTEERDATFWERHCWHRRFDGEVCAEPATYQGPKDKGAFCAAWRACAQHAFESDMPFPTPPAQED